MSKDQIKVVVGAVAATIFSAAFFAAMFRSTAIGMTPPGGIEASGRLAYALRWEVFAALCLLAGVGKIANRRFFVAEAIGGDASPSIEIDRRYLQNTLEQLVLAIVAHLALVTIVAPESIRAVAVLVMLFVIGRVTFWIGYHYSGPARAFGFATTFYPTVAVYVFVASRIVG
ncbi:MAG: MAPEG family protein [Candidatus Binatus sp.]